MSKLGRHQLHELYFHLKLTRRLEEEIERLDREGRIPGGFSLARGVEAVGVGSAYLLETEDLIASALPSLAPLLVKGVPPGEVLAHLFGSRCPAGEGKDGWLHFGNRASGVFPRTGHLAAHVGVMAGVAFAAKYQKTPQVAVAVVTERALATGDFHEGLNFSVVQRLPLILVVQNDPGSWGSVQLLDQHDVYERVRGYGVASLPADGSDVLQMLQVMDTAIDRARRGNGPTVIEARARRWPRAFSRQEVLAAPFVSADTPATERRGGPTELADPVDHFDTFLSEHGLLRPDEAVSIRDRIERVVEGALAAAEARPRPDPEELGGGVRFESSRRATEPV